MRNATFAATSIWSASVRWLIVAAVVVAGIIWAMLATVAAPTASAETTLGTHHTGPDYQSITGYRIGAPSEQEVSVYGGSHKHLWVEQQLYGPGVVYVPQVDSSVHQSH
jgi:hypothetical protein